MCMILYWLVEIHVQYPYYQHWYLSLVICYFISMCAYFLAINNSFRFVYCISILRKKFTKPQWIFNHFHITSISFSSLSDPIPLAPWRLWSWQIKSYFTWKKSKNYIWNQITILLFFLYFLLFSDLNLSSLLPFIPIILKNSPPPSAALLCTPNVNPPHDWCPIGLPYKWPWLVPADRRRLSILPCLPC